MYIDYKEQINNPFFSLPLVLGDTLRALTCSFQSGSQSTLPGQHSKLTVVEQAIFKIFVPIWGGGRGPTGICSMHMQVSTAARSRRECHCELPDMTAAN